ncbi:type IV protein arginine methyltransferase, partial [Tremellales sp. Uapishka_1]
MSSELPPDLLPLANKLLHAAQVAPLSEVERLLTAGAPAWYQDESLGWSSLHYAAERRQPELIRALLKGGAVWNAIDHAGRTAGEICLSFGDEEGWQMIRNEGVRSEILHHMLGSSDEKEGNLTLRNEDDTSAGDNLKFLRSSLTWETGDDGKERVLDEDGNGYVGVELDANSLADQCLPRVMMGWEEPLMVEHVRYMTESHPDAQPGAAGMSILNVGYGLGIVDRLFQTRQSPDQPKPLHHTIIEAHPLVLEHLRSQGVDKWPGVRILEGRWQDWLLDPEKLGEVLEGTPEGAGFGGVFVDTFAEGYEGESHLLQRGGPLINPLGSDLKAFFEVLPDILDGEDGIFSFWNGLGATSQSHISFYRLTMIPDPTIYSVSAELAEFHLEDVGLTVEWHDVSIPESLREEVWKGVRRRYWELPSYRLPIAKMKFN